MLASALALLFALDPVVAEYRDAGLDRVARAYQVADPSYRSAVADAVAWVDPDGERPWLAAELWRICLRESRCGQYGSPGLHEVDAWTGERAYRRAVQRGRLDPGRCLEHREDARGLRRWGTRGGWGMNAARAVRWLWPCAEPEALDDPRNAALAAARALVECERDGRDCTCSERAAMWIGAGLLRSRPLWSRRGKSRIRSVARQCGDRVAVAYVFRELARMHVALRGL